MNTFCTNCGSAIPAPAAGAGGGGGGGASGMGRALGDGARTDGRYDKSGLPHYPDGGSGILTTSAFDDVVHWYRKNLPPGWSSTTVGPMIAQKGDKPVEIMTSIHVGS